MKKYIGFLLSSIPLVAFANNNLWSCDYLHTDWLDKSVLVKQDFYNFANGAWLEKNPIPSEYSSWGSFSVLEEKNRNEIHEMLKNAALDKHVKPGSIEQKVGDFYYSGMDTKNIDKLGVKPLNKEFARINAVKDLAALQKEIIHLHQLGVGGIFNFSSMQDFADSTKVIAAVEQSGLSLPDRDYYLKDDKKFKYIRDEFVKHMTEMFVLLGENREIAIRKANTVMAIETELAKASLSQIELRDPKAVYHIMNLQELNQLTPNFSWTNYFKEMGHSELKEINIGMPNFMRYVNKALITFSINDWQTYLTWHLLDGAAPYLSQPFVMQNFHMAAIMSGMQTLPARWKRVVSTENGFLGFAVGELFVKKYFSHADKAEVMGMIHNIRTVLRSDLQNLSWMSKQTKEQAIKKLDLIEQRVGYPDKWRDYSSLQIDRGPYILNVLRCSKFLVKYDLDKIGKPVDRTEWEMTPQMVNAYYHQSMNSINIPMGILQPPYFNPKAPVAINYGAIGAVIGHEITHGFDDQGAKFDAAGNLHDWWMPKDLKKFQKATNCIVQQYSNYKVNDNVSLQGKLVVGEATADLGGLILAYRAFHLSKEYKNAKVIDGYTPDQQFFISFAHSWANNARPEQELNLATIDPHPPAKYRVNGTLANMSQFQKAFNVAGESDMVNKNRCMIW
ncbi:MAG: metallopeptidase [Legionellales bacterium RIFCSPHIGHO2_12_FULL_35_11]|nr:MAG: metallopeptidase [Legionellales bacterium RIFCSPHIGHO2_12_FULL_35_11]